MIAVRTHVTLPKEKELFSRSSRSRLTAVGVVALSAWILPQSPADAAGFGAKWEMNETSGTIMHDATGNGNAGTLHTVKLNGSSYGFNGSSSYVSVPNSPTLNPGSSNVRLTVMVKINTRPSTNNDYDLIRKGLASTSGGNYKLEILDTGKALCRFKGSSAGVTLQSGSALSTGSFHTITCTKTATKVTLAVDGATRQSTVTVGSIANSADVFLGAKPGDDFLNGSMNQASILPA